MSTLTRSTFRERVGTLDVLVLTAVLWFLAKFLRYAFPPLFGTLQRSYGLSNTELGVIYTALLLGYAVMQFPSGVLADRFGTVRVITGGAVVASAASLLLFVSATYLTLLVAVVFIGIGTGAHKTVAITLLSTVYPDQTGRALGAMDTLGELAGVAAPAVVVFLLAAVLGWQYLYLVGALGGIALAVAFRLRVSDRLTDATATATDDATPTGGDADAADTTGGALDVGVHEYLDVFRSTAFLALVGLSVLIAFAMNGIVSFLPLYLSAETGLSAEVAGLLYSGYFLVALVQPLTGDLADRLGYLVVLGGTIVVGTVGLISLLVGSGALLLGVAVLTLGVGLHGSRPARDAFLVSLVPDDAAGGTLGIVRTGMMVSGAASPAIVGYLSDTVNFTVAFWVLVAALVASTALVGFVAVLD